MTDVRERPSHHDESTLEVAQRETLVSRALAPLRRVTRLDLAVAASRQLALRRAPETDLGQNVTSYAGIVRWSFILVVLMPVFATGVYFFFVASDQYVAEARYAVRQSSPLDGQPMSGEKGGASTGGSPLGAGIDLRTQDAEIIANYIKSRAIVEDISRTLDLRAIFRRPGTDGLARLRADASVEELTDYWGRMISVYLEGSSGITTVSASAFRRDDALAIVRAILVSSDALANSLSTKMQSDQTRLAEEEVVRSEGQVRFALADLQSFRNSEHLIDPVENSKSIGKLLFELIAKRIDAEGQLFVARRSQGPTAPGMATLQAKLESINGQIKDLQDQLAGDKEATKNLASSLSRFEGLELKKKFAEHMFTFSENGLDRARLSAIRQAVYLEVFVQPSLPQDYAFPLRFTDFALISIGAVMIWLCGLTISASILDHRI